MIYGLISELSSCYPVRILCRLLGVSRSAYYEFVSGRSWHPGPARQRLAEALEKSFEEHKGRYGSRRLCVELRAKGYEVGRYQVRSLMRSLSLEAIQPRSFVPRTTQPDAATARSPNLLIGREPVCSTIREVIVGDITYWPSQSGWLYLAVWMDLFSRRILGWKVDDHMRAELVIKAFEQLPWHSGSIHSDGGTQYKAKDRSGMEV
jgi:putative transposase